MNKGGKNCIYGQFSKNEYIRGAVALRDSRTNIFVFRAQRVKECLAMLYLEEG